MYAICIESSHSRGMGHLFRALNWVDFFNTNSIPYIVIINNDEKATQILESRSVKYERADYSDVSGKWELEVIGKYGIQNWINDRMDTDAQHARVVKNSGVRLITFDDSGSGAALSDFNVVALSFNKKERFHGGRVLFGVEYLILNKDIDKYKRIRTQTDRVVVSLGGSDTYGTTVKVVKILKTIKKCATVILGPSFNHFDTLYDVVDDSIEIKTSVPSLVEEFYKYDIAITSGGVTAFEANAAGLPCFIIANEVHEIEAGKYLQELGSSIYAGYCQDSAYALFDKPYDVFSMSRIGINFLDTKGIERIFRQMEKRHK